MTILGHFFIKGVHHICSREFVRENSQYYNNFAKNQNLRGKKKKKHWSYKSIVSGRKMAKIRHQKIPLEIGAPNK
jgi:hypothetical protein